MKFFTGGKLKGGGQGPEHGYDGDEGQPALSLGRRGVPLGFSGLLAWLCHGASAILPLAGYSHGEEIREIFVIPGVG